MAESVGAVHVEFTTSTAQLRQEIAKGSEAVKGFGESVRRTAQTTSGSFGASNGYTATFGKLGEQAKGASASVAGFSKVVEAMGERVSPVIKGIGSAVSALAMGGFTPLGLAIGAATAAIGALASRTEESQKALESFRETIRGIKQDVDRLNFGGGDKQFQLYQNLQAAFALPQGGSAGSWETREKAIRAAQDALVEYDKYLAEVRKKEDAQQEYIEAMAAQAETFRALARRPGTAAAAWAGNGGPSPQGEPMDYRYGGYMRQSDYPLPLGWFARDDSKPLTERIDGLSWRDQMGADQEAKDAIYQRGQDDAEAYADGFFARQEEEWSDRWSEVAGAESAAPVAGPGRMDLKAIPESFGGGFARGMDQIKENLLTIGEMGAAVAGDLATRFGDAFSAVVTGTKSAGEAFKQFAGMVLQNLVGMFAQRMAMGAMASAFGFMGFAEGGSFNVRGTGGTDSQLVAFRATPGERVDVTPPGKAGPGGGSGGAVTVNVYNSASGVEAKASTRSGPRGPEIDVIVQEIVSSDLERGGRISRALERTHGVQRQGRRG